VTICIKAKKYLKDKVFVSIVAVIIFMLFFSVIISIKGMPKYVQSSSAGDERLDLSERVYHCDVCGLTMDRDVNSALVIKNRMEILKRTTVGQTGSNASGDVASTIQLVSQVASMNQEHTLQPFVAGEAHTL